jgi:hypothetical protein
MSNAHAAPSTCNLWPHAIIAWFVIFGSAMAAWITFAVRQNLDLVRADYYEDEVHYQQHLNRLKQTLPIRDHVAIQYDALKSEMMVQLPTPPPNGKVTGRILFYRPSEAALDFEVPLGVDDQGRQQIPLGNLRAGLWKARAEWRSAGQEFFFEQVFVADTASK